MARRQNYTIDNLEVGSLKGLGAETEIDIASGDNLQLNSGQIEFVTGGKSGAETFKFADDSGATCADLASAVGTVSGVIKVKIGSTTAYIPTYEGYTAS